MNGPQTTAISRRVPVAAVTAADRGERAAASSVIFWLESVDAELLLQARRGGRVLEHQPLVRIDVAVRLLRHQRALVESGQDQLQLAGIGVDVADRENAGHIGFE